MHTNTMDGAGSASPLVTVKEAAELLNVSVRTVWKLLKEGVLKRVQLGDRITQIHRQEIVDLIRKCTEDSHVA